MQIVYTNYRADIINIQYVNNGSCPHPLAAVCYRSDRDFMRNAGFKTSEVPQSAPGGGKNSEVCPFIPCSVMEIMKGIHLDIPG
jgi:hypothetical protein